MMNGVSAAGAARRQSKMRMQTATMREPRRKLITYSSSGGDGCQADDPGRIFDAHRGELGLVHSERFHIGPHQTDTFDRVREERLAGIARERAVFYADRTDRGVHLCRVDSQQR